MNYCAIDFGTSNSAVAVPDGGALKLAPVEGAYTTLPTSVFFNTDENTREFGRAALAAYIDGFDGRLMRSMKSILGSPLAENSTDLGDGSAIKYTDVIAIFVEHLKRSAKRALAAPIHRAVLGRPVFFVDDDPRADQMAQQQLEAAARSVGLREIHFQYEPIAAAFDYESHLTEEGLVLVADIGGGTSDFSLVRVGPERMKRVERKDDVLAHHGVHVAGTDFDRRVELATILRELGYQSLDPEGREIPNRIYFDLATWHLINTVYAPEARQRTRADAAPVHRGQASRPPDARRGPPSRPCAGCARGRGEDRRGGGRRDRDRPRRSGGRPAPRVRRSAAHQGRPGRNAAASCRRRATRCRRPAWRLATSARFTSRAARRDWRFSRAHWRRHFRMPKRYSATVSRVSQPDSVFTRGVCSDKPQTTNRILRR